MQKEKKNPKGRDQGADEEEVASANQVPGPQTTREKDEAKEKPRS